jgi:SAM-dependent methyltransferase
VPAARGTPKDPSPCRGRPAAVRDARHPRGDVRAAAHLPLHVVAGEARLGSEPEVDHDGQTTIRALGWFDLRDPSRWKPSLYATRGTADQLLRLRAALGYRRTEPKPAQWGPEYGSVFAEPSVAAAYRHRPPYPPAAIAALVGLLAPRTPARVLDAGCGTGHVARRLAPLVEQVDAVDIAPTMITAGQPDPGGDHPHIRWACSPLETFAADPPYALIVAGSSLHWMEWEVVLPHFASWLAPGGVLVLLDERTKPMPWADEIRPVVTRFSGAGAAISDGARRRPGPGRQGPRGAAGSPWGRRRAAAAARPRSPP